MMMEDIYYNTVQLLFILENKNYYKKMTFYLHGQEQLLVKHIYIRILLIRPHLLDI